MGGDLNTLHDQGTIVGLAHLLTEWLDDPSQAPLEPLLNVPPPFLDAYIPHHKSPNLTHSARDSISPYFQIACIWVRHPCARLMTVQSILHDSHGRTK